LLDSAGLLNMFAHGGAAATVLRRWSVEIGERYRWHLNVQVNAIQEWATDLANVSVDGRWGAFAWSARIAKKTAWARIHRRNQNEVRRER
jgi:hypothetical protein